MNTEKKKLLITGGTGSFGSTLLKKIIHDPSYDEIRVFSRDEKKQNDLRLSHSSDKLNFYIGDVRNINSLEEAINGVDYIFHAAALKQVPSCEFFPLEATYTNVLGTNNVLTLAKRNKVKKVICLSTDKAAYPINAMGITKALMEKVATANSRHESNTTICLTRYGNVMASRGSVIPLFIDQIKANRPLTITNPDMTRFLMTLNDAIDLVYFAFENGQNGDLFVHKAPAATIHTLAQALQQIFEAKNKDISIIGTRHGEKLFETLCTKEEMSKSDDMGGYFRIPPDNRDLNYSKFFDDGEGEEKFKNEYNSHNTQRLNVEETIELLLTVDYVKECLKYQ